MRKRSSKRGHPDKYIFKAMSKFKPDHKKILLNSMKDAMIKIMNDEYTVEETMSYLENITESLNKLKKHYENN